MNNVEQASELWDEIQRHQEIISNLQTKIHQLLIIEEKWVYYGANPETWIINPAINPPVIDDKENAAWYRYAFFVDTVD